MNRWLAWGCGGLLAVGALIRLGASSGKEEAASAERTPARPGAARPTPASVSLEEYRKALLQDDSLPAPAPGAPASHKEAFSETIQSIERGQDPLVGGRPSILETLPPEMKVRLQKRRNAAEEHRRQNRRRMEGLRKKVEEAKAAARAKAGRSTLPPSQRPASLQDDPATLEPPNLGPPLLDAPKKP